MDLRTRLINHHRRWNIEFDDEEQFTQLKNRVASIVNRTVGDSFAANKEIDREFAELLGNSVEIVESSHHPTQFFAGMSRFAGENKREFGATYLYRALDDSSDLKRIVTVLQVLFWLLERRDYSQQIRKLVELLRPSVKLTPSVEFQIARKGDKVTLYPSGAQLLDEATVNQPLMWLENYPKVAEPFELALKLHLDGDNNRNLLDNLRFAVEQLLREVLGNKKPLEKQKTPLLQWIRKDDRIHKQVANMYSTLLFGHYSEYQNDAVKHSENWSEEEVEFMIYLTGTFMRLLIQLSDSSRAPVED